MNIQIGLSRLKRALGVLLLSASVAFGTVVALAVEPNEVLKDPELEQRARKLSAELRCLVCQNQSIDDSNAPLARDLRLLVRERLTAGDSDDAIIDYIVARYGEFVLLRPQFGWHTLLLWFSPLLLLLAGLALARMAIQRQPKENENSAHMEPAKPLTNAEQQRLEHLLSTHRQDS